MGFLVPHQPVWYLQIPAPAKSMLRQALWELIPSRMLQVAPAFTTAQQKLSSPMHLMQAFLITVLTVRNSLLPYLIFLPGQMPEYLLLQPVV